MANVGDVVVQLKATTAQFTGPLRQVQQELTRTTQGVQQVGHAVAQASVSLQTIRSDIARVGADFKRGAADAGTMAQAFAVARQQASALGQTARAQVERDILAVRTELRQAGTQARLTAADLSQAAAAFDGTTAAVAATAPAAARARQGLGTIRSSLASLTTQMAGARGTLGTLLGGITQFAVGNTVAIGIIGGIAAMVAGFRALTRAAREAREAARETGRQLQQAFQQRTGLDIQGRLRQARGERDRIQQEFDRARAGRSVVVGRIQGEPQFQTVVDENEVARLAEELRVAQINFDEAARAAADFYQNQDRIREATEKANDELRRQKELLMALQSTLTPQVVADTGGVGLRFDDPERIETPRILPTLTDELKGAHEELRRAGARAGKAYTEAFAAQQDHFERAGLVVGESVLRGTIRALTDRNADLGQIFANTIAALLEEALVSAIRSAIERTRQAANLIDVIQGGLLGLLGSGGNPVGAAIGAAGGLAKGGGGSSKSVAAPVSIVIAPNISAPSTPFDVSRDAEWQKALRESILVARSQGFAV